MKSVNFTNLTLNIKHLNLNYEKRDSVILKSEFPLKNVRDSVILKSEFPLKNIPRFLHDFEKRLSSEKRTEISLNVEKRVSSEKCTEI